MSLALLVQALGTAWGQEAGIAVADKYSAPLKRIFDLDARFAPLHPALGKVYPVAIVENKTFYIFVPVSGEKVYRLVRTTPDTFNIPTGIRTAMPLPFWDTRVACVRWSACPKTGAAKTSPYNRVTFYCGGEKLIRFPERRRPGIVNNLEELYRAISARQRTRK